MEERLQKVMAKAGIASRRHAETFITAGRVMVNGAVVTTLGTKVDPEKDHIKVDGKRIQIEDKKVYLMLNKPRGVITSVQDPEGRPTVMQFFSECKVRLYPVGRLDFNTEGLLLLTNDGDLAHKLTHPRFEIQKRYWVKVEGSLTDTQIAKLERGGISTPGGKTASCKVFRLPPRKGTGEKKGPSENSWWEIILHEGKNREVHHLMEKVGHSVLKLKRIGFAHLTLGSLPPGGTRSLTPQEISGLYKSVSKTSHKFRSEQMTPTGPPSTRPSRRPRLQRLLSTVKHPSGIPLGRRRHPRRETN